MNADSKIIPDRFRPDLERAVSVLREHGAQEIYLFGSIVEPDDIDIAVSGLRAESFLHAYGILLGELEQLTNEIDGVRPLFEKPASHEPDGIELRTAALTLRSFYNGVEAATSQCRCYGASRRGPFHQWHRHRAMTPLSRLLGRPTAACSSECPTRVSDWSFMPIRTSLPTHRRGQQASLPSPG